MDVTKIEVTDEALRKGAAEGMDGFLQVFIDKYLEVTGGVHGASRLGTVAVIDALTFGMIAGEQFAKMKA